MLEEKVIDLIIYWIRTSECPEETIEYVSGEYPFYDWDTLAQRECGECGKKTGSFYSTYCLEHLPPSQSNVDMEVVKQILKDHFAEAVAEHINNATPLMSLMRKT
jgi:hypothetical protein